MPVKAGVPKGKQKPFRGVPPRSQKASSYYRRGLTPPNVVISGPVKNTPDVITINRGNVGGERVIMSIEYEKNGVYMGKADYSAEAKPLTVTPLNNSVYPPAVELKKEAEKPKPVYTLDIAQAQAKAVLAKRAEAAKVGPSYAETKRALAGGPREYREAILPSYENQTSEFMKIRGEAAKSREYLPLLAQNNAYYNKSINTLNEASAQANKSEGNDLKNPIILYEFREMKDAENKTYVQEIPHTFWTKEGVNAYVNKQKAALNTGWAQNKATEYDVLQNLKDPIVKINETPQGLKDMKRELRAKDDLLSMLPSIEPIHNFIMEPIYSYTDKNPEAKSLEFRLFGGKGPKIADIPLSKRPKTLETLGEELYYALGGEGKKEVQKPLSQVEAEYNTDIIENLDFYKKLETRKLVMGTVSAATLGTAAAAGWGGSMVIGAGSWGASYVPGEMARKGTYEFTGDKLISGVVGAGVMMGTGTAAAWGMGKGLNSLIGSTTTVKAKALTYSETATPSGDKLPDLIRYPKGRGVSIGRKIPEVMNTETVYSSADINTYNALGKARPYSVIGRANSQAVTVKGVSIGQKLPDLIRYPKGSGGSLGYPIGERSTIYSKGSGEYFLTGNKKYGGQYWDVAKVQDTIKINADGSFSLRKIAQEGALGSKAITYPKNSFKIKSPSGKPIKVNVRPGGSLKGIVPDLKNYDAKTYSLVKNIANNPGYQADIELRGSKYNLGLTGRDKILYSEESLNIFKKPGKLIPDIKILKSKTGGYTSGGGSSGGKSRGYLDMPSGDLVLKSVVMPKTVTVPKAISRPPSFSGETIAAVKLKQETELFKNMVTSQAEIGGMVSTASLILPQIKPINIMSRDMSQGRDMVLIQAPKMDYNVASFSGQDSRYMLLNREYQGPEYKRALRYDTILNNRNAQDSVFSLNLNRAQRQDTLPVVINIPDIKPINMVPAVGKIDLGKPDIINPGPKIIPLWPPAFGSGGTGYGYPDYYKNFKVSHKLRILDIVAPSFKLPKMPGFKTKKKKRK